MSELEESHVQVKNKSKKLLLSQKQLLTENKQLKEKISALKKSQEESIASSSSFNEEKSALLAQISEYSELIKSQSDQLAALSTQCAAMESAMSANEPEKARLSKELASATERLKMGESRLFELSEKCKIYQNTNAQLQSFFDAETAQRDEEKSSLLSQIEGLTSENEENRRQIQAIQQERDSTVSKMRQEIEQLHLVSHESKELADRLGQLEYTLQSQAVKMEDEKAFFEKARQELEVKVQTLTLQNEELLKCANNPQSTPVDPVMQAKLIELQSQNQFFEAKINELTDLIDSQKTQISYINDEKNSIQDELAQLSAAKAAADQLLSSQHAEIVRLSDEQNENAEFMDEREQLTRKLADQEDILTKLQYAITSEIGQELQSDSSFSDDPSAPISERIQAAISAYFRNQQKTSIELKSANENLIQLTQERDRIQKEYREVCEQVVELQKERESSGGQFIPSQRDYFYSDGNQNGAKETDQTFGEALEEAIRHEKTKFKGEKESLQYRIKSLEAQVNNLESLLEEADKEQIRNQSSQNHSNSNNKIEQEINKDHKQAPEEIAFYNQQNNQAQYINSFQEPESAQNFFKPADQNNPADSFTETTEEQTSFFTANNEKNTEEATLQQNSFFTPGEQTGLLPTPEAPGQIEDSFAPTQDTQNTASFFQPNSQHENDFAPPPVQPEIAGDYQAKKEQQASFFIPNVAESQTEETTVNSVANSFLNEPTPSATSFFAPNDQQTVQENPVASSFFSNEPAQNANSFFTPNVENETPVDSFDPVPAPVPAPVQMPPPITPPARQFQPAENSFQQNQEAPSFFKPNVENEIPVDSFSPVQPPVQVPPPVPHPQPVENSFQQNQAASSFFTPNVETSQNQAAQSFFVPNNESTQSAFAHAQQEPASFFKPNTDDSFEQSQSSAFDNFSQQPSQNQTVEDENFNSASKFFS